LEKERPDALEMAAQKDEEREEAQKTEIKPQGLYSKYFFLVPLYIYSRS
jgi:hypothetical protein